MLQNSLITLLILLCSGAFGLVFGQTPDSLKPIYVAGEVTAVADKKFTINAKSGPMDIVVTDKTVFRHASVDNPSLTTATAGMITDIGVGDKLTVSGILATDGKTLPARQILYVTKGDVAGKNAKDSDEWKKRGITGKVVAVNPQTNQMTLEVRQMVGSTRSVLTPKEHAKFLRYAPDSIRFDEAKPSNMEETKVGDMVRALGDKSSDGTSFAAEQIISGAFQTIAGTVKSIDAAKNEIVITNLQNKKEVIISVTNTSVLKRYPAEMAERLAGAQNAGGARPAGQNNPGGGVQIRPANPGGQGQAPGAGRGGFGGGRAPGGAAGAGNIDEMLDRFPNITASELKVGDMIALSSSKSADMSRIKAIKLLAGVEPFLRAAQAGNGRGRQGAGIGDEGGFSIPGLDGVSFP